MDTDADYLLAVAWMNAYRADPDAAAMIVEQFHEGRIGLEQGIEALVGLVGQYHQNRLGISHQSG